MKTSIILLLFCCSSAQVLITTANSLSKDIQPHFARLVGGTNAAPHSAPWIISLQRGVSSATMEHYCGGSIIASNWVVTAGHCIKSIPSYGTCVVIAGRHNIMINENSEQRRKVNRKKTWIHEDYKGAQEPYDIGLIRLDQGFTFNYYVASIRLPPVNGKKYTGNVRLYGWGSTSMTSEPSYPSILQTVLMPLLSFKDCSEALGRSPFHYTNICTGPVTGGACSADSGGPISQDGFLVGITSWTQPPCGKYPTVYVAVSSVLNWIKNIMKNHN